MTTQLANPRAKMLAVPILALSILFASTGALGGPVSLTKRTLSGSGRAALHKFEEDPATTLNGHKCIDAGPVPQQYAAHTMLASPPNIELADCYQCIKVTNASKSGSKNKHTCRSSWCHTVNDGLMAACTLVHSFR